MTFRFAPRSLLQTVILGFSLAGAIVFATAALAANIDYEGETVGAVPPSTQLLFDGPFYVTALDVSEIEDGVACAPNCPDNGTKYQLSHGSGFAGALLITGEPLPLSCEPNCRRFDLFRIDVAEPSPGTGPIGLIFLGSSPDVSLQFDFTTDGIVDGPGGQEDFETVVLPDTFRDLNSVLIISAAPYMGVAIDNIIVEPEIEPVPALGPFGLGTLALSLCAGAAWRSSNLKTGRNIKAVSIA